MKKTAYLVAVVAITSLSLLYALWGVDYRKLGQVMMGADLRVLAPFFLFLVLFYLFTGLRWNLILRPLGRYSLQQSAPAMMIGFAGNNILPAHMGELVRAVLFGRKFGKPGSSVLATLVVERILDVFAILFFYFLAILLIKPFPESIRLGAVTAALITGLLSALIFLFLFFPKWFQTVFLRLGFWLPTGLREKINTLLENAVNGLSALKSPGVVLGMLIFSLLKWSAGGAMVWFALQGFDVRISFNVSMVVIAVTALAVTVPSAPGYIGTLQAAFIFALTPFGIPREVALAASVLYVIAQWVPVTLIGGLLFFSTGLKIPEMSEAARHVRD